MKNLAKEAAETILTTGMSARQEANFIINLCREKKIDDVETFRRLVSDEIFTLIYK